MSDLTSQSKELGSFFTQCETGTSGSLEFPKGSNDIVSWEFKPIKGSKFKVVVQYNSRFSSIVTKDFYFNYKKDLIEDSKDFITLHESKLNVKVTLKP